MKSPFTSKYHPDSQALMGYAEGLVDRQALLNPEVATHLKTCVRCHEQVHEIRDSLRIINAVEEVEALSDMTASILLAAKQEPRHSHSMNVWLRNTAVAASLLLMATFGLGFIGEQQSIPTASHETKQLIVEEFVEDSILRHAPIPQSTPAENLIAPVLLDARRSPETKWERAQYRALDVYGDDIEEAELAYASNPGLIRAYNTILTTQEVRDETLAAVYMDGH